MVALSAPGPSFADGACSLTFNQDNITSLVTGCSWTNRGGAGRISFVVAGIEAQAADILPQTDGSMILLASLDPLNIDVQWFVNWSVD